MLVARRSSWYLGALGARLGHIRTNTTTAAHHESVKPYSEVPGPKPWPIIGNAWVFIPGIGQFDPTDALKMGFGMYNRYGNIVKMSHVPGRRDMVFLFNPESIEKVFRNEGRWPERFPQGSFQYFRSEVRKDFFEGNLGILQESGEKWQKARTVVNQPMMQPRVAKQYAGKIDQVAQDFVKRIPEFREANLEMPASFSNELHKWALESIALVALDTRLGCLEPTLPHASDQQKMIEAVEKMFLASFELDLKLSLWKYFTTPALKQFIKHSDIFLQISTKYVERARENMSDSTPEVEQSVLQKILTRDPSTKRAVIMAMDMMMAGIDTTSNTVGTVLYHLARNPECQERLFAEVSKVMPAGPSEPLTAENLDSMKYLKACIKEAMRLTPIVAGTIRSLDHEIEVDNYLIPKNVDFVMMSSILCNMDKHYPEAHSYKPERWLRGEDKCPLSHTNTHPFVYMPFGHGPRQCVGMRFANLEMETLVARMVRNYRLEWHHADLKYVNKMLQVPDGPLKFKIIDRPT